MNEFLATILTAVVAFFGGGDMPAQEPMFGAPIQSIQRNIVPEADSTYYLGTTTPSTVAWASLITDQICLTGDTCRTTWPTGGGGGSGVFPFSSDTNFAQVVYSTSTPTLWFKSGVFASSTSWFTNITSTNATSTNATTTRLGITGIASSLLKTTSTGGVVAAVAGTDYQIYAFPFTTQTNFGTTTKATSTSIWSGGVFFASSTVAASQFPYASSTAITVSGTASSTNLVVSGLNAANCDVKSSTSGVLSCGTDATGGGGGSGSISTSSPGVVSSLLYFTTAGATPELVNPVATTTLTGTSPLSFSNPVAKVGGSNSVLSWDFSVANIWTGLQRFNAAASSTQISATRAYFGGTATTTITQGGFVGIASSTPTYPLVVEGGSNTTPALFVSNVDNFVQGVVWNKNSGTTASADFVGQNNLSCPEASCGYYVNLGINSSNYSNATYSASGPNDSYLYANDDNLVIGTASTTDLTASLIFTSGGFTSGHERMRLTRGGMFGIGTTTPAWSLQIASSTRPQLTLSDASATSNHWSFRSAGGILYIATSSPTTWATSTPAALTLQPGSTALGIASTTFSGMLGLGPSTSNGSSTIAAGKIQIDGYNSAGTRICTYLVSTAWVVSTGACNQ